MFPSKFSLFAHSLTAHILSFQDLIQTLHVQNLTWVDNNMEQCLWASAVLYEKLDSY